MPKKGTRGTGQGQKGSGTYTGAKKIGRETDISDAVVKKDGGATGGRKGR